MKLVARAFCLAFVAIILNGCVTSSYYKSEQLERGSADHRILLMPTDVELSVLTAGGIKEPHAEWTTKAKSHIAPAMRAMLKQYDVHVIEYASDGAAETLEPEHVQLVKLHNAVGASVILHRYVPVLALPSKENKFDWTLGPEAQRLRARHNADYALFVYLRDSYASAGRAAVIFAAAILGVSVQGGTQVGFASLVDLHTGEIVWFNQLARGHGDLRTEDKATESIEALLVDFPK